MDGAAGAPAMRRSDGTLAWMQVVESSQEQRPRAPKVGALGNAGAIAEAGIY